MRASNPQHGKCLLFRASSVNSPPSTSTTLRCSSPARDTSSSLVRSSSHGFRRLWRRLTAGCAGVDAGGADDNDGPLEELACGALTMCCILDGSTPGLWGSVGNRRAGRKDALGLRRCCCCCCCWEVDIGQRCGARNGGGRP